MKKLIALLLALVMMFAVVGCAINSNQNDDNQKESTADTEGTDDSTGGNKDNPAVKSEGVMTYAEYLAAEENSTVVIEAYVQATQTWWNDSITIYAQDTEGGYFLYNITCSQADAAKLIKGAKIRVTGTRTTWAGEVEINGGTLEVLEGNYVAPITDVTSVLASEDLASYMNRYVSFKGMTVVAADDNGAAFLYNWDGSGMEGSDSDLYFKASLDGNVYTFVIEYYLCGPDSDAYKAVQALEVGDVIDMEGFLYWYEGMQPHIISVTVAE